LKPRPKEARSQGNQNFPRISSMAAYQYVYHMDGVSKTYPGGKNALKISD